MSRKQKKMLVRIIIAAVMLIALKFIPVRGLVQLHCIWSRTWSLDMIFCARRARASSTGGSLTRIF